MVRPYHRTACTVLGTVQSPPRFTPLILLLRVNHLNDLLDRVGRAQVLRANGHAHGVAQELVSQLPDLLGPGRTIHW